MIPDSLAQKTAQEILNRRANGGLEPDGYFGPDSIKIAQKYLVTWDFKGEPTRDRYVAAVIQKDALARGLNPGKFDAYFGPQTDDAGDRMAEIFFGVPLFGRPDDEQELIKLPGIAGAVPKIKCWNPSTAQFRSKYGQEGSGQGMVQSPYPLRLDWDLDTITKRFSAHESLVARIEAAMGEILAHYGLEGIYKLGLDRFGGCLNVRLKRGGSTPSVHSWGAAIDWFPSANTLKMTKRTAVFARADYFAFFAIWEKYGFMSLGRCFDFDFMHVQANP